MNTSEQLVQSVVIMLTLVLLFAILRRFGLLKKENSSFTSNLVLKITLPALIFSALVTQKFEFHILLASGFVSIAEIVSIILAWIAAKLIKLKNAETGALMLVSAFGMSTMLGYPLIRQTFPGNSNAMEDAVIISEIGVGLLLFILGPIIAMHYGENNVKEKAITASIGKFLTSPIFISIIAGISISFINLPENNIALNTISKLLTLIGNANIFLVAITIGLLIEPHNFKKLGGFLLIAITLKLIIQPLITYSLASFSGMDSLTTQVAIIETAMPSAILVAIYARQYNCKPEIVSTTILVTLILSLISVTAFFNIFY